MQAHPNIKKKILAYCTLITQCSLDKQTKESSH